MTDKTYEDVIADVKNLSPAQMLHLVEEIMEMLKPAVQTQSASRHPVFGIWSEVSVSADEIDEARREMWSNFPREDI
jgi:hypothetical protein